MLKVISLLSHFSPFAERAGSAANKGIMLRELSEKSEERGRGL